MTQDIDDKWGVTISPPRSVGKNQYTAEGVLFRKSDPGQDVHTVIGEGRHKVQTQKNTYEKAKSWVAEQG